MMPKLQALTLLKQTIEVMNFFPKLICAVRTHPLIAATPPVITAWRSDLYKSLRKDFIIIGAPVRQNNRIPRLSVYISSVTFIIQDFPYWMPLMYVLVPSTFTLSYSESRNVFINVRKHWPSLLSVYNWITTKSW